MKTLIYFLISICLLKMISGECYTENPSNVKTCESKKRNGHRCCLVEYRTDRDPEYKKLCVEIKDEDIEKGKHEATMILIEGGNYTNSDWNETIMEKFRNYSTISNFDCNATFLYKSLFLFSLLFIIF